MEKRVSWKKIASECLAKQRGAEERIKSLVKEQDAQRDREEELSKKYVSLTQKYATSRSEVKKLKGQIEESSKELEGRRQKRDRYLEKRSAELKEKKKKINRLLKSKLFLKKRVKELSDQLYVARKQLDNLNHFYGPVIGKVIFNINKVIVAITIRIKRWTKRE